MSDTENAAFDDGYKRGVAFAMREFDAKLETVTERINTALQRHVDHEGRIEALEARAATSGKSTAGLLTLFDHLEPGLDEHTGRLDTLTDQLAETHHALESRLKALEGRMPFVVEVETPPPTPLKEHHGSGNPHYEPHASNPPPEHAPEEPEGKARRKFAAERYDAGYADGYDTGYQEGFDNCAGVWKAKPPEGGKEKGDS